MDYFIESYALFTSFDKSFELIERNVEYIEWHIYSLHPKDDWVIKSQC